MGRPSVMGILRVLDAAGDEGLQAGQVAALFDEPADQSRRNRLVNNHLGYMSGGKVRRSEHREPSLRYNKVPTYRWWITEDGREYLAAGGMEAMIARNRLEGLRRGGRRTVRLSLHRAQLERASAMAAALPPGCRRARNAFVKELYGSDLTLEEIGGLVGLTRERVRQIARGRLMGQPRRRYGERPCRCTACQRDRLELALADLDNSFPQTLGDVYRDWERHTALEDASSLAVSNHCWCPR